MPKFYVKSGGLERIVTAKTPQKACEKAIDQCNGETLDSHFYVDERGFRSPLDTMDTTVVLVTDLGTEKIDREPKWSFPVEDIINVAGEENE